ncbi:hypothetical protein [Anaeromyxobacter diazotrophicus]|uniref:Glycosyltransferase RgtA/B/C/D-like domain-containing protein n=1 Tax=Anaeromyxobacter diazotrophicus TaxID=2590199 RepID=A0A7I9VGY2_9BACT|nr:hypothetical protein [Anaeromyxobacter diazotrophicus]GEJ55652.1 hypothetical protein AMYX_03930 [Anaeromyxobacter diazotrophicus]
MRRAEDQTSGGRLGMARLAPVALILAVAAAALAAGWGRWGSFVLDTGRELEWPRRILRGERLYSDLRYYYGPLAPYLNALLYRLFGVRLEVLATAGAATGVATALTLHAIAARFVGRWAAVAPAIGFVCVLAFAHLGPEGIFNFVLPYSFAATYGMLSALLSLAFLLRHHDSGGAAPFAASAAWLALAGLCKVEPLTPALAAHGVFACAALLSRRLRWLHVAGYAAAATVVGAVYGFLYARTGPALFRDNLGGVLNPGSDHFIRQVMGLTDLRENLVAAALSVAVLGCASGVALGAAALARSARLRPPARAAVVAASGLAVLAFAASLSPDRPFRALPFLALGAAGFWALRWWRDLGSRTESLPHLLLAVFTVAASLRITFAATPAHYGFFMLAPALVWLGVFLFGDLRRLAPDSPWTRRAVAACGAALFVGNSAAATFSSSRFLAERTVHLSLPRGTVWLAPELLEPAAPFEQIARAPPASSLLVLPHAAAINFLLERRGCADGMASHLPMEFYGGYREAAVIARWERDPPDLVLWYKWIMRDMGDQLFGVTYAVEAGRWIRAHYEPVTDPYAPIVLLRRRPGAAQRAAPPAP